jgi:hypothetical protein
VLTLSTMITTPTLTRQMANHKCLTLTTLLSKITFEIIRLQRWPPSHPSLAYNVENSLTYDVARPPARHSLTILKDHSLTVLTCPPTHHSLKTLQSITHTSVLSSRSHHPVLNTIILSYGALSAPRHTGATVIHRRERADRRCLNILRSRIGRVHEATNRRTSIILFPGSFYHSQY